MTPRVYVQRLTAIWTLFAFLGNLCLQPPVHAQEVVLPAPGQMVHLSQPFNPPVLKGLKVHPENPFRFDFILDQGNEKEKRGHNKVSPFLKQEANKLIKYFLASLTVPEKDLWVNLSPTDHR